MDIKTFKKRLAYLVVAGLTVGSVSEVATIYASENREANTGSTLINEHIQVQSTTPDAVEPTQTIGAIRNGNLGRVAFTGTVTRVVENSSKNSFYVQDATGGMYVYSVIGGDKVAEGDSVLVQGKLESYSNLLEITGATVTKLEAPALSVKPKEMTIKEYLANPNAYESQLICFKDVTLGEINYSGNTTITDGTGEIVIHKMAPGIEENYDKYDVIALGARYKNTYQLSVVAAKDVTPTEGILKIDNVVVKQGEKLNLPVTTEVITDGIRTQEVVTWHQKDIEQVDTETLGNYTIGYTVRGREFEMQVTVVSVAGMRISDIQGKAHVSPLKGSQVAGIQGVVTAIDKKYGFYMQDLSPDNDEATSDAIYVESYNHGLSVGTLVEVSGTVDEEIGYTTNTSSDSTLQLTNTQITATHVKTLEKGVALPEAVIIGKNGRMPKVKDIIDNDHFTVFDPEEDFIDFYESLEGMMIAIEDAQVVGGNKYEEIPVVADRGMHSSNGLSMQGGVVVSANTMHPEIMHLVKGMYTKQPTVMVGDVFAGTIKGIMTYNDGNYKVAVAETLPEIETHTYDADRATTLKETADGLRIAGFNVENLGGDAKQSKIDEIAKVFVEKLYNPDIIALQEVQDNTGSTDDGTVAADIVYTRIIEAIKVLAPEVNYAYVEIVPENNADGGAPGGNIRVGMLYRTDRVQLAKRAAGDTITATSVIKNEDGSCELSLNPGRIEPQNSAFEDTRKSLATEFMFNGERIFVINNHLSSKGGDTPLFGNVQPADLQSEVNRTKQAEVVNNFVKEILAVEKEAKIVVLGDMNDYYFSNPVKALAGDVLYNMLYALPETERYTYSYQGKSQVLDNVLVTNGLEKYTEIDILHMNSSRAKGVQLSDHDPVMIRINMGQIKDEAKEETESTGGSNASSSHDRFDGVIEVTTKPAVPTVGETNYVTFKDITNHWAKQDIEYLANKGIVKGVDGMKFAPNKGMKAIDFKTLLSRIYEGEITLGTLKEGQTLTRAQVAVLLKNTIANGVKSDTTKLVAQFKDIKGVSDEEIEALAYLYEHGLLQGISDEKMSPHTTLTRAQVATIMVRLLNLTK